MDQALDYIGIFLLLSGGISFAAYLFCRCMDYFERKIIDARGFVRHLFTRTRKEME